MLLCPGERGGQIFADLDQERRHVPEICALVLYERRNNSKQSWRTIAGLPAPSDVTVHLGFDLMLGIAV
jgi:hypothetical protein